MTSGLYLAVAILALSATMASAQPECLAITQLTEAMVRSSDNSGFQIAIYGDTIPTLAPGGAAAAIGIVLDKPGQTFEIQNVVFRSTLNPQRILFDVKQNTDFDISTNATATITLPNNFFTGNVACPPFRLRIQPSAGLVVTTSLDIPITETDVNGDGNVSALVKDIVCENDEFVNNNVLIASVLPDGLQMSFQLVNPTTIRLTVAVNTTFNINRTDVVEVRLIFRSTMMRSGISPRTGNAQETKDAILSVEGARPNVSPVYVSSLGTDCDGAILATDQDCQGIRSEAMWDGTAILHLDLTADTWLLNTSAWTDPATEPEYKEDKRQPNGFNLLKLRNLRPSVVLTPRRASLYFPAMPGFSYSNTEIESIVISGMNALVTEPATSTDQEISFTFRIQKVKQESIRLTWEGIPFQRALVEDEIRKVGLSFTVEVKYDVFTGMNPTLARSMFDQLDTTPLDLSPLATDFNGTAGNPQFILNVTIPSDINYNILRNEIFNLTISNIMLAGQLQPPKPRAGFVIQPLPVSPRCSSVTGKITEKDVREKSNLNITIEVVTPGESFCPTNGSLGMLMDNLLPNTLTYRYLVNSSQQIVIGIEQDPTYDLDLTEIVQIPLPTELMCSLEMCRPDPEPGTQYSENTILQVIQTTPGRVVFFMDNYVLDEQIIRTVGVTMYVYLEGETFAAALGYGSDLRFIVTGAAGDARGWDDTVSPHCTATRCLPWAAGCPGSTANKSLVVLNCPPQPSFDIHQQENITINVGARITASGKRPDHATVDRLTINPQQGAVVLLGTTLQNSTLNEDDMVAGGFTMRLALEHERWQNNVTLSSVIASSIRFDPFVPENVGDGMAAYASLVFGPGAFSVDDTGKFLNITFIPAPGYNILLPELFTIRFGAGAVLGALEPTDSVLAFHVELAPPRYIGDRFGAENHSMIIGIRDVVLGAPDLYIRIENDLFVETNRDQAGLCAFASTCIIERTADERALRIIWTPQDDYVVLANVTYELTMLPRYFKQGKVPDGKITIKVFVTAGILAWSGPSTPIDENMVRRGQIPPITVRVSGDTFIIVPGSDNNARSKEIRRAFAQSVKCIGTNDEYGFCSRAATLFNSVDIQITDDSRQFTVRLQADQEYDIYEPETATLVLNGVAMSSRLAPSTTENFTMTIGVTNGTFFLSGFPRTISRLDLNGVSGNLIRVVLTLYGERFKADKKSIVTEMAFRGFRTLSEGAGNSGFMPSRSSLVRPSAAQLDDDKRVMVLQFMPLEGYSMNERSETIAISIPENIVLSGKSPVLGSTSDTFTVIDAGGIVVPGVTETTASVIREQGLNYTLVISNANWNLQFVSDPLNDLDATIRSESSPQQEPNGFTVLKAKLLERVDAKGAVVNASELKLQILKVPTYNLIQPETWIFEITPSWTTKQDLPVDPSRFTLRVDPDFRKIVATVRYNGTWDQRTWREAVALQLSVHSSQIDIESVEQEPKLPDLPEYRRVIFRVKGEPTANIEFDNKAAELFISMDDGLKEVNFNVVASFYNSTPPDDGFWERFRTDVPTDTPAPKPPLGTEYLALMAGILVIIVIMIGVYAYYRRGEGEAGIKRVRGDREKHIEGVDESADFNSMDKIYSGQRQETFMLNAKSQAKMVKPEEGMVELATVKVAPKATTNPFAEDDLDVPLKLYHGQGNAVPPRPENTARFDREAYSQLTHYREDYGVRQNRTIYPSYGARSGMLTTKSRLFGGTGDSQIPQDDIL